MTTFLLIDDDPALSHVLSEALRLKFSADVICAATADEALGRVQEIEHIDFLIVDYHLGAITGIELGHRLRDRYPGLPILVYTGKATPEVEAEARRLRASIAWKPQRLSVLVEIIQKALTDEEG